jgi:streptogramin lyase
MPRTQSFLMALAFIVGLLATAAVPAFADYRVKLTVGKPGGSENGYNDPGGVTLDGHGHLFVADTLNNRIVKVDSFGGGYQFDWSASGDPFFKTLSKPFTVSADERGDVWVVDSSGRVQAFDGTGAWLGELPIDSPGQVNSATADLHGHVFVTRYDTIDPDNALIFPGFRSWGETWTRSGVLVNRIGIGQGPASGGVAFGPNKHLYALDRIANTVIDYDLKGVTPTATWTAPEGGSAFKDPAAVDVDQYGFVYVAEDVGHRIVKMTPKGRLVATLEAKRGSLGQFSPGGVAVLDNGQVWASDSKNDRLVLFEPSHPETIIDAPPRGIDANDLDVDIPVSSDVKGARFDCTIDDGKPERCGKGGVTQVHFPSLGNYVLTVRAVNKQGVRDLVPARLRVRIETSKPGITSASYRLTPDTQVFVNAGFPDGGIPIDLSFRARDKGTRVRDLQYELLARYGLTGPFAPYSTTEAFSRSRRRASNVAAGLSSSFKVQVRDLAGNVAEREIAPPVLASVRQDSNAAVVYTGTTAPVDATAYPGAWGGSARTLEPGATATLDFTGHGISVVVRKQDGPSRHARICTGNGTGACETIDAGGGAADRQVVFARAVKQGPHTITVTATDEVTLDAFVVLKGG